MTKRKKLIFLLIIIAIATFFRLWQLSSIPPGLYPDVAMNGNDAIETLNTYNLKVFYPDNNGREGLFMWLIALSFSIFGVSVWSIKIVAAVIGILTVLGLYLLTKEFFNHYENASRQIALLASFFLAISFWHVNFSRLGFRAILLPFVLVFGFYFLFKGFRQKKLLLFVIAGVFFGFGFYTYISYRFIVLLLPVVLIYWLLVYLEEKQMKKFLLFTASCLLFTFVIALPMGIYFIKNPQDFIGRATPISIFAAENPLMEFGKSLILHLGMFNIYGDSNWRHNYATSPELFWPIGILFLIGVIISFREIFRKSPYQEKNYQSLFIFYFLFSFFFIMLLPGILTYEGIPHSLRVIGVIPAVFIFSGLGAWKTYEFLNKNIKPPEGPPTKIWWGAYGASKKLLIFSCFFFLLALAASEFNKYFVLWANNDKVKEAYNQNYADIGYFLNSLSQDVKKYVIINTPSSPLYGISIAAQTPLFIETTKFGKPRATYLKFENLDQIDIYQRKSVVIPLYDDGVFAELSKKFPWGEIKKEKDFQYYDLSY